MPFVRNSFVRTALVKKSFVRIAICFNFHSLEIPFVRKTLRLLKFDNKIHLTIVSYVIT
jgi:hypothetical protein